MFTEPLSPLSFAAGLAILTNACAIMQNGATTRYNLSITQWRDFCASEAQQDGRLALQYVDPGSAVVLADRRVRIQLLGLVLLNAAVALFAATTVMGLVGAFLIQAQSVASPVVTLVMVTAGTASLLFLLAFTVTFFQESACGRRLLRLHRHIGQEAAAPPAPDPLAPGIIGAIADRLPGLRRAAASEN